MDDIARELLEGVDAALAPWVERCVVRLVEVWTGAPPPAAVRVDAAEAGAAARDEVMPQLLRLLARDVDDQRDTPLAIVRRAVVYPAAVLRRAGVPPVERDAFAEQQFPHDDYDLTPASFADLDPDLADVGLRWAAAKAWEHKRRHRQEQP